MPMYEVTYRLTTTADSQEDAALEADRLLLANRPREYSVTAPRAPTVFIRVERGQAKRIA